MINGLQAIEEGMCAIPNGIIFIGELKSLVEAHAVQAFVDTLTWPVIADITSMLRHRYARLATYPNQPDTVLLIGGPLTSQTSLAQLKAYKDRPQVHIRYANRPFNPFGAKQTIVEGPLLSDLGVLKRGGSVQRQAITKQVTVPCDDPLIPCLITDLVDVAETQQAALFGGNSLAIRYLDTYYPLKAVSIPVFASRGASGIDGQLATIAGLATGLKQPMVGIVGDLTFLYDCNALALISAASVPIWVVVLNNGGGRIFDTVPHIQNLPEREAYFTLPQTTDLSDLARAFHCRYVKVTSVAEWTTVIQAGFVGTQVIDVELVKR